MSRTDPPLPPLGTIEAALHETTERLAREISQPTRSPPQWSEFEWRIAEAAAVLQGITALLANRLEWRGPDRWTAFLTEQKRQTLLRQQRVAQWLERIDSHAWHAGVPLVALKGAALCRLGLYPAGDRPMSDIDLLVRPAAADAVARLLAELGYHEGTATDRHRVFETRAPEAVIRFGEHIDNPLKIELHTRIAERLPVAETDITALEFPPQAHAGINSYPSIAAAMRHLLLHMANNMRARALRFGQMHDVALVAARMDAGDWEELLRHGVDARGLWWAFAPLTLTARYYPNVIPQAAVETAAVGCPRLLRRVARRHRLVDVSWSKIRIQAFPGIEWSKSPREALQFMASRAAPSRSALDELHAVAVKRPYSKATPWYGLSHINRIARWVFTNPPRVQAIYPIKIVLGIQPP